MTPIPVGIKNRRAIISRRGARISFVAPQYLRRMLAYQSTSLQELQTQPRTSQLVTVLSCTDIRSTSHTPVAVDPCAGVFADWTILDESVSEEQLAQCMDLRRRWSEVCVQQMQQVQQLALVPYVPDRRCSLYDHWHSTVCYPALPAPTVAQDYDEVMVEPELPVMKLLLPAKACLPLVLSGPLLSLLSSSGVVLMDSIARLLFTTRHLQPVTYRFALPPPPAWMRAIEMDPPNTMVTTVSLPTGWDTVSARASTSSIFNVFSSDSTVSLRPLSGWNYYRSLTTVPSLFGIDPTGVTSSTTTWGLSPIGRESCMCMCRAVPASGRPQSSASTVSLPSALFCTQRNASASSLFPDPRSASSLFDIDPSGESTSAASLHSLWSMMSWTEYCASCGCYHDEHDDMQETADNEYELLSDEEEEKSRHTYVVSGASSSSSGYESDVELSECEPLLKKNKAVQTGKTAQKSPSEMVDECDEMIVKLIALKKKFQNAMH